MFVKSLLIETERLGELGYSVNLEHFSIIDSKLILSIYTNKPDENSKVLAEFFIDNKENKIDFLNLLPFSIASNYLKYDLKNSLHNFVSNSNFIALSFGNVIYDLKNNRTYNIPIDEIEFASVKDIVTNLVARKEYFYYRLIDVKPDLNGEIVSVLYINTRDELKLLKFEIKSSKLIIDKILIANYKKKFLLDYPKFCKSNGSYIHYFRQDKHIEHLTFE